MDCLTFLTRKPRKEPFSLYVVAGDEAFLRRRALEKLRQEILGDASEEFACSVFQGDGTDWSVARNEVSTLPFLSERRLVIVESADGFVKNHRAKLEKFVKEEPPKTGVLILDLKSWPSNTKLAKMIDKNATITCKAPSVPKLVDWCCQWALDHHDKQLVKNAAQWLVELVGQEMGLLDQEIAKLAVYVGDAKKISRQDVDRLVGNNRADKIFKIFNLIGQGQVAGALAFLDRALSLGDDPMALWGGMSWHLRRLAQAARLTQEGKSITGAVREVGLYDSTGAIQQMKHLGRRRLAKLYDWLVEFDLGVKGDSTLPPRTLLERLIIRLR